MIESESGTFTTSDGCPIAYSVAKASRPSDQRIVLIHSLGLDRSIWTGVVPRLADDAHVLFYDCRGHGRSGRRAEAFTTDQFARDLAELLDHVGWRSAAVVGCSMGGCVAMAFAGLYPGRATALALFDTTAWYGKDGPAAWSERATLARSKGFAGMVDFQVTRWFGDSFRSSHPEVVKALTAVYLANDIECYVSTCVLLGEADLQPYLPNLRLPVAVIVGEDDYATPLAMAEYLHQSIQGSTLTVLPGARHITPTERPEEVASQIRDVMRRAGQQLPASA